MTGTENSTATTGDHGAWLPIESAPKDGSRFLIWTINGFGHDHVKTGLWSEGQIRSMFEDGEVLGHIVEEWATHWMPLPAPPTLSEHQSDDNSETRKMLSPIQTTNKSP